MNNNIGDKFIVKRNIKTISKIFKKHQILEIVKNNNLFVILKDEKEKIICLNKLDIEKFLDKVDKVDE